MKQINRSMTPKKLLAVKFAHKYCELHKNDESKVTESGGN